MGSFGERLRREREMRGITIEEIAEATKIGSRSLRALEDEQFERLPGGIFNKGFVRSYARYLGIDEEQAVADYLAAESAFRSGEPPPPIVESYVERKREAQLAAGIGARRSSASVYVAVVVFIAALAFAGWKYYGTRLALHSAEPIVAAASTGPTAGATPPPAVSTRSLPARPPSSPARPGDASPAPEMKPAAAADGFVVRVLAREDSWVSFTADGKVISEVLRSANEKSVQAHERVVLKLGNAGGVEVSYNGKLLDIGATPGQVKTLVFTAEGLQREASAPR